MNQNPNKNDLSKLGIDGVKISVKMINGCLCKFLMKYGMGLVIYFKVGHNHAVQIETFVEESISEGNEQLEMYLAGILFYLMITKFSYATR